MNRLIRCVYFGMYSGDILSREEHLSTDYLNVVRIHKLVNSDKGNKLTSFLHFYGIFTLLHINFKLLSLKLGYKQKSKK